MEVLHKYFSDFTEKQTEQFAALQGLYADWNDKINVISRKDMENFYLKHVLHSLAIASLFEFADGTEVLDLGTGGGFPGIPLAIMFPEVKFHLVDSINKKLKVVNEIVQAIGLSNVTTQHIRAEEIKDKKFDVVVSRAVAPLGSLWNWSKMILRKNKNTELPNLNGLICLKGGDLTQEIADSGCRPNVWELHAIFPEKEFEEKYILYQKL